MEKVFMFNPGPLSDNIMKVLLKCDPAVIQELKEQDAFLLEDGRFSLSPFRLKITALDAYARAAHVPMYKLLFGSDHRVMPTYTPNDAALISILSFPKEDALRELLGYMRANYFTSAYDRKDLYTMRLRLRYLYVEHPKPKEDEAGDGSFVKQYQHPLEDIKADIARYLSFRYIQQFHINESLLLDLATYYGVSAHWLLRLDEPLYCDNAIAEEIFDRYTLLPEKEQIAFVQFCNSLVSQQTQWFTALFQNPEKKMPGENHIEGGTKNDAGRTASRRASK